MKHLIATVAAAVLAGCTSVITPDQEAEAKRRAPSCSAGPDCSAKWAAAQLWVVQHISFKLEMSGDYLLQTGGPNVIEWGNGSSQRLAATVRREPDGPQRFRIVATLTCGNVFGCLPEWQDALLDFNRTVAAAAAQ